MKRVFALILVFCLGAANNLWACYWCQGADIVDANGELAFADGENKQAMLNALNFLKRTVDEAIPLFQ